MRDYGIFNLTKSERSELFFFGRLVNKLLHEMGLTRNEGEYSDLEVTFDNACETYWKVKQEVMSNHKNDNLQKRGWTW